MLENPPMWLSWNNSAKKSGPKFIHSNVNDSLPVIVNAWLQLLLQRVAQPVIRFRGQLIFHIVPGRFGQLFSLNKWNHYFKTVLYLPELYLCNIKMCLMIWIIQMWHICKKTKCTGNRAKNFLLYKYTYINAAIKWLVAINHIQNKSFCLHNIYVGVMCIFIMYT